MASSSHLNKGGKGILKTKISTLNKKGVTVETITVFSNDPKRPKVVLSVQTTILEALTQPIEQEICK